MDAFVTAVARGSRSGVEGRRSATPMRNGPGRFLTRFAHNNAPDAGSREASGREGPDDREMGNGGRKRSGGGGGGGCGGGGGREEGLAPARRTPGG
jgi:hypothetical protein